MLLVVGDLRSVEVAGSGDPATTEETFGQWQVGRPCHNRLVENNEAASILSF